jgi:methyl-accepting chemotaxis protein
VTLDVGVLETSFDLISPRANELVDHFYARLFETAPNTREIFERVDMERQKRAMVATLGTLRAALRHFETIVPTIEALGERHVRYGARPEHYPVITAVLVDSMAEIGGSQWRPQYSAAWADALGVIAGTMLRGSAAAGAAQLETSETGLPATHAHRPDPVP